MIFKITCHNNDYTNIIRMAIEHSRCCLLYDIPKNQIDKFKDKDWDKENKFRALFNPNTNIEPTLKYINYACNRIKSNILEYIMKFNFDEMKYIEANLQVTFQKLFKYKFENGESIYYFPFNEDRYLVQ